MTTMNAAVVVRGGVLMFSKPWALHSPTTIGCFSASSKRERNPIHFQLHPQHHLGGGGVRKASFFEQKRSLFRISTSLEAEAETSIGSPSTSISSSSSPSPTDHVNVDALDIRVGRILRAWLHPEADSLYVEQVDVGEPEPRTICSGLVRYIPLDHLQGMKVVVLANLKPRNMRGVKSNGMLLAASDASHENVELLLAPEGSVPGERIWFGLEEDKENQFAAANPNQVQKKKIWEMVQPHLKTDGSCVAAFGLRPMRTSAGVVVCRSLQNANIS